MPQRLKMLAGGARDLPMRQQTIRNAIAWSYDLLDDAERELFSQLGIFPGDFAIESAELVCDTSLDVIASLVDKSLVQRTGERLAMLETIRTFAAEKLSASPFADDIGDRHAAHFEALVADADAQRGSDEKAALDRLEVEHDNLRAALDWLRTNAPARFVAMVGSLVGLWHLHSHFGEGVTVARSNSRTRSASGLKWRSRCRALRWRPPERATRNAPSCSAAQRRQSSMRWASIFRAFVSGADCSIGITVSRDPHSVMARTRRGKRDARSDSRARSPRRCEDDPV